MANKLKQAVSQWRTFDTWVGVIGTTLVVGGAFALLGGAQFVVVAKHVLPAVGYAIIGTIVYFLVAEVAVPLVTARRPYPLFPEDRVKDWSVAKMVVIGLFGNYAGIAAFTMAAFVLVVGFAATNPTTAAMLIDAVTRWAGVSQ